VTRRVRLWLRRALARSERVVARRVGGELVLVPRAGSGADLDGVMSLQGVAPFIWERLDGTRTGAAIVDAIVAEYAVERTRAAADYVELAEALRDAGAALPAPLVRAGRATPSRRSPLPARAASRRAARPRRARRR
jgi:hypothetical protein